MDRPDAVVDRARAGIIERKADEAIGFEACKDLVADRSIQHLLLMLDGAEQKRHRQHIHRRHDGSDQCDVGAVEIDRSDPGLLQRFFLLAELVGMEHLDLMAAAAALRDQAAHVVQRLDGRIILVLGIGRPKFARGNTR